MQAVILSIGDELALGQTVDTNTAYLAAKLAERGNSERFRFPRPMTDRPGLDFSFSGLKTFTLNTIAEHRQADGMPDDQTMADIACAFQDAIEQTGLHTLVIAGGVSANKLLRQRLETDMARRGAKVFYARHEFCTDNGAMIAYAGCQRMLAGQGDDLAIRAVPRWPMDTLAPVL